MSPKSSEYVELVLLLKNLRQFVSGTEQAAKGVKQVGTETEKTGEKAKFSWKSVAKWGGIATAAYGASRFLHSAVNATEDLGRSTLALSRSTGLDIKTGSEWAAVLQSRGMQTKTFQRGLVTLSKEITKTAAGTKKHDSALEQLGITSYDTAVRQGNVQAVLLKVSDALSRMHNPALRAALAQKLLGRQAILMAPLLFKGSAAIQEQLDLANKFGATLQGKNAKAVQAEIQHQRELNLAWTGAKVQLGTALLPVLILVTGWIVKLAEAMQPLTKRAWLLYTVIGALVTLFALYRIAMIAATIAQAGFNVALFITLGWIALVIVALVALGIGIYEIVKHWGAIKAVAVDVWNWIKGHWPLLVAILVGPFAVAALLVVQHFGAIKKAIVGVVNAGIAALRRLVSYVKSIPRRIGGGALGVLGKATGFVGRHVPGLQAGGHVTRSGGVLVGERGPEVLTLPTGAQVTPLEPGSLALPGGLGGGEFTVHVPVILDRRVLAEAVGRFTSDELARR